MPRFDLERHLGELLLGQLVAGDRLAEHDALLRVLERRLEARARRADRAPDDPVARLVRGTTAGRAARASGSRFSSGTRTSSSTSSDVTDARSDSLWWISGVANPGVPVSTRKPRIVAVLGARPDDRDVGDRCRS